MIRNHEHTYFFPRFVQVTRMAFFPALGWNHSALLPLVWSWTPQIRCLICHLTSAAICMAWRDNRQHTFSYDDPYGSVVSEGQEELRSRRIYSILLWHFMIATMIRAAAEAGRHLQARLCRPAYGQHIGACYLGILFPVYVGRMQIGSSSDPTINTSSS